MLHLCCLKRISSITPLLKVVLSATSFCHANKIFKKIPYSCQKLTDFAQLSRGDPAADKMAPRHHWPEAFRILAPFIKTF